MSKNTFSDNRAVLGFSTQLIATFTTTVLLFSFFNFYTSINNDRKYAEEQFIEQAKQITANFSRQSILPLMFGFVESSGGVIDSTLGFKDVWRLSVHDKRGLTLFNKGKEDPFYSTLVFNNEITQKQPFASYLEHETESRWYFTAPVYSLQDDLEEKSPFDAKKESSEFIGFVRVAFSKEQINKRFQEIIITSAIHTLLFALITISLLLWLTSKLTGPLARLVKLMHKAESGEEKIRATEGGPRELREMGRAFNKMMDVLEARAVQLDDNNVSLLREVEERKLAEKQQEKLLKQLQQSQKMEAIGQLTGGIAHDFNNMLASIMGYTSLAQERFKKLNPKLEEYLGEILAASERARDLIAQMLAFSRGSASKPQALQIRPIVKEAIKMLQSTMPSSIDVEVNIGQSLPKIKMDPVKMHQIIMNLCINARDAMDNHGEIHVTIQEVSFVRGVNCSSCVELIEGEYIELQVKDSGMGIDANHLLRVFDPFFTTKEVGKGTGMGLSMVHGIVHEHDGHIVVESTPDVGTVFRLFFPVIQDEEMQPPLIMKDMDTTGAIQQLKGSILIVDDEVSVGKYLKELLVMEGFEVDVRSSSQDALELFNKEPGKYDVIITDQMMPGLTGMELVRAILDCRPDMPIIMCSGYDKALSKDRVLKSGVRKFFNKPVDSQLLISEILDIINSAAASKNKSTMNSIHH